MLEKGNIDDHQYVAEYDFFQTLVSEKTDVYNPAVSSEESEFDSSQVEDEEEEEEEDQVILKKPKIKKKPEISKEEIQNRTKRKVIKAQKDNKIVNDPPLSKKLKTTNTLKQKNPTQQKIPTKSAKKEIGKREIQKRELSSELNKKMIDTKKEMPKIQKRELTRLSKKEVPRKSSHDLNKEKELNSPKLEHNRESKRRLVEDREVLKGKDNREDLKKSHKEKRELSIENREQMMRERREKKSQIDRNELSNERRESSKRKLLHYEEPNLKETTTKYESFRRDSEQFDLKKRRSRSREIEEKKFQSPPRSPQSSDNPFHNKFIGPPKMPNDLTLFQKNQPLPFPKKPNFFFTKVPRSKNIQKLFNDPSKNPPPPKLIG